MTTNENDLKNNPMYQDWCEYQRRFPNDRTIENAFDYAWLKQERRLGKLESKLEISEELRAMPIEKTKPRFSFFSLFRY